MTDTAPAISLQHIWKTFGSQVVLEDISLDVRTGSFLSLVGPSGCGKSTFLRMLLGVEAPSRGTILVDGAPLEDEPSPQRGVVFQRYSVFPHLTTLGNVLLGLEFSQAPLAAKLFGRARRAARDEAIALLKNVGLGGALDKYPAELSGGMQQRLALAQSLVMKPKILLLDEPFGALDPGIRADIHALMLDLWRNLGMTVIMVTHDLSEAFKLGTRVICLDRRQDRQNEIARGATVTFDLTLNKTLPEAKTREPAIGSAIRQSGAERPAARPGTMAFASG